MTPLVKVFMPPSELLMPALERTLYSGMIAEGQQVYDFEEEFMQQFSLKNGLAMSSGTSALHSALILAGVGPGDEVLTTSMTAEPTNLAILYSGGIPVFVDVDSNSGNMSPEFIEERITQKTKAIVVVHYAGIPVRLNEISEIAKRYGISLIEDCAHALGAKYNGDSIGTQSDFSIYSFQAIKHMTTVDGGFLVIRDQELLVKAKKIRWFGMEKGQARTELNIDTLGYKYNMHNVAATIGLVQLQGLNKRIDLHKSNGRFFDREIPKISGLNIPIFDNIAEPSYWLYTIFSDDSDSIIEKLKEINIQASKLHRPNHLHTIFNNVDCMLPNLDCYYNKMVHIPCGWWVTNDERENVVKVLKKG